MTTAVGRPLAPTSAKVTSQRSMTRGVRAWPLIASAVIAALGIDCWGGYNVSMRAGDGSDPSNAVDARAEGDMKDMAINTDSIISADTAANTDGAKVVCAMGCVLNSTEVPPRTECSSAGTGCAGVCGPGCSIQCKGGADCNVTVSKGGAFECDMGSSCSVVIDDPRAIVECTNSSACQITCKTACTFECKKMATCEVQCAAGAPAKITSTGGSCP